MQVLGIVIFVVVLTLVLFLICGEVIWLIKRIRNYRKSKNDNNVEKKGE